MTREELQKPFDDQMLSVVQTESNRAILNGKVHARWNSYNTYLSFTKNESQYLDENAGDKITMHISEPFLIMSREIAEKYGFPVACLHTDNKRVRVACPMFWSEHRYNAVRYYSGWDEESKFHGRDLCR